MRSLVIAEFRHSNGINEMFPRVLEVEVMDTVAEACDYDRMDHRAVNALFVGDLRAAVGRSLAGESWLDVGTGTAQIPIELAQQEEGVRIVGIDLAREMLRLGEQNVAAAGFQDRIALQWVDAKQMPFASGQFRGVMSNSIVHHIPEPLQVLREMVRVLQPGGWLFVRDLLRPRSETERQQLVAQHAVGANTHQRQMFSDSLGAALTLEEVADLLIGCGLPARWVQQTSDRHWTVCGQLAE